MNRRYLEKNVAELSDLIRDYSESIVDDGVGGREPMTDDFAAWLDQQSVTFDRASFWDACGAARCPRGHEATGNMGVAWCETCNESLEDVAERLMDEGLEPCSSGS